MLINLSLTLFQMAYLFFPKNKQYFPKNRKLNLYIQKNLTFFKKEAKPPIHKQGRIRNRIKHRPKKTTYSTPLPSVFFNTFAPISTTKFLAFLQ
jgi:hypothetical protein